MPLLTDTRELKSLLDINIEDTSEDKNLLFYAEFATDWITEILNRPGLFFKSRTEYYNGTGSQKLLLRSRPVYTTPTIQVFVDQSGYWGSASDSFNPTTSALTYGKDFALWIDQPDGATSRSGILLRLNDYWPRISAREQGKLTPFVVPGYGVIKVTYTAGWTIDNLPSTLRLACNQLVAMMRNLFPLGVQLTGESYEERNVQYLISHKDGLITPTLRGLIMSHRNFTFR